MWRIHLFEFFRAENAEKVIPSHLGSSLDPWSPVWGNHLFELFRAENAEKVFPRIWAPLFLIKKYHGSSVS